MATSRELLFVALAAMLFAGGCGGGGSTPTTPTPSPTPTPTPAASPARFTGTVTDTVTGAPVAGFTATLNGSRVTVSAPGYITRDTTNRPNVDLIPSSPPFDLSFYRQFVRNGLTGATLEPLRRQAGSFRLFVNTVDQAGRPVSTDTINVVTNAITNALIESYSGGAVHLLGVEQGVGTRVGTPGYITVCA